MDRLIHRVRGRIERGERISTEDCRALLDVRDLNRLSQLSRIVRERRYGTDAFFTVADIVAPDRAEEELEGGAPSLPRLLDPSPSNNRLAPPAVVDDVVVRLQEDPDLSVRLDPRLLIDVEAETSLGELFGRFEEVNRERMTVGPGGAFSDDPFWGEGRTTPEAWLAIHQAAHEAGITTDAGIAIHDAADPDRLVEFLDLIRTLQQKTGGFRSIRPLPYISDRFDEEPHRRGPSAALLLRVSAILRLYFDTVDHVALPVRLVDPEVAFVALSYGVDTIDTYGTPVEAEADPVAGSEELLPVISTSEKGAGEDLLRLVEERIVEARFRPVPVTPAFERMTLVEE